MTRPSATGLLARAALFLACLPSGAAVLTEVYGVAPLHDVVWFLAVPGYAVLAVVWVLARNSRGEPARELADAIAIGAVGGLIATIAYDVVRIPFVMSGIRVYVPNSTYGLWLLGSETSTRFSETVGWLYHFANGTMFGVMYALLMRGRHWGFAIIWACLLETIALVSPYGVVYQLAGKPVIIAIAYFGHVAYGLPLGFMVQRWEASARYLRAIPPIGRATTVILIAASVAGSLTLPSQIAVDTRAKPSTFLVEDGRLLPDWLHLRQAGSVVLRNVCTSPSLVVLDGRELPELARCEERRIELGEPGIHQLFVRSPSFRSHSSFVLVDPVAKAKKWTP